MNSAGINETDCDPEEETRLIKRLLYDNSSPRPPEEFVSENFDAAIESFSPSPIPVKDSDSFKKEIDLSFTSNDSMPPGIEEDDYDFERDILILKELLRNNSFSFPENESVHFDIPSSSRSPAKPPNAGSKDRPPMLAPGNYVQWKSRIKRYIDTKPNHELIHYCLENPPYELGIDNDIYSIVDACPNACEMWKAIERLKQGESINVQDLETNLYWKFGKFTSHDSESLESYYSRFYKMMNELIRNQFKVTNHQNSSTRSQQATTRNRGKAIVNSSQPIYDQEPSMVDEDDETSKDKEIDKLMALISLSFKKIYKPTNNNLRTSSNTSRANQNNSPTINKNAGYKSQRIGNAVGARETKPKRAKDAAYHREKMLLCKQEEAGIQLNAKQADWKDDTDVESDDQELVAHYMYMAKVQEVSPDVVDSGPIFDTEPKQKVHNYDHYDVFAIDCQHPEQSKTVHKTYLIEQDAQNIVLELSYNQSKEVNNKLSQENDLLYVDYKKSQAELARRNTKEYASPMELECAKEMVVDLRYFNSLELEVDSLTSQLETQRTQIVNEID
nr:hypothetical protein [Tanacetum cinerariifolium]